jgi:hypothetical protein
VVLTICASARAGDDIELLGVKRIWDQAPHNAFTSLVRFQDQWICAFREASAHAGKGIEGKMRVISSKDGEKWESVTLLADERGDIRDAKLSITPAGELMLLTATHLRPPASRHQSVAWFTKDLKTWEGPVDVGESNVWLWGIRWHKGTAYSIGYGTAGDRFVRMYKTTDGRKFERVVDRFDIPAPFPNENAMVIDDHDVATVLLRCDPDKAFVGRASPPYKDWTWKQTNARVGGPALIITESGKLLGGGRFYDGQQRTSLFWVDPEKATITECLKLPSKGDTSYPGLVFHDGTLYVSYYSSHEEKTCIYLAKCKLPAEKADSGRLNEILTSALRKRGSFVSVHAAEALVSLGQKDLVRAAFEPQAGTSEVPYRIGVWRALALSSPEPQRTQYIDKIRAVMFDSTAGDHVHAMEALAKINAKFADEKERAFVEQSAMAPDSAASFAAWRLVQADDPRGLALLVKMIGSSDEGTRARAANALALLESSTPEVRKALSDALPHESTTSAARPLMIVARGGDAVRQLLSDATPSSRYHAAMYFSRHGDAHDAGALEPLVGDSDPDVQVAAACALLRIQRQTQSAVNALEGSKR